MLRFDIGLHRNARAFRFLAPAPVARLPHRIGRHAGIILHLRVGHIIDAVIIEQLCLCHACTSGKQQGQHPPQPAH
ncbi:hypothetical protein DMP17_06015 [Pseudonocardia sp. TMWB2A]